MRKALPLLVLAACGSSKHATPAAAACDAGAATAAASPPTLRLPGDAAPTAYRASLTVDPRKESFTGHIEIDVDVKRATDVLWLDAQDLTLTSATVRAQGDETPLEVIAEPRDFVGLRGHFTPGPVVLAIDYTGVQTDGRGLGAIRHQAAGDWYIVTQFEPTGARRVFPSFDEPGYKVPWTVDLTVPKDMMALDNEPVAKEEPVGTDQRRVWFAKSPNLPSYLIAFAVGPFDAVDGGKTSGGAPIHIIVPRGRGGDAGYAAAETGKIVGALEDYTGIAYPFDKLDMLAIPNGLGGAMENPGLVTYGEKWLLIPASESENARSGFIGIAAHELGHQWFGDLVTMAWWDDLWLNEAFATWIAPKITAAIHPEMQAELSVVGSRASALDSDSLSTARQIRQPITADADISAAFDNITYQKGASVLKMFEEWLGEDVFRKGAQAYLHAHARGNATAADFLAALDQASGKDVTGAFSTFLDQPGEPLVKMKLACGDKSGVTLEQSRFLARGASSPAGDAKWKIPVCVVADGARVCSLLDTTTGAVPLPSCPKAVVALPGGVGYYRVAFDGATSPAGDRAALIAWFDDLGALAIGGAGDPAAWLAAADQLGGDRDLALADRGEGAYDRATAIVADADRDAFAKKVGGTFGAAARKLGWLPVAGEDVVASRLHAYLPAFVAVHGRDKQLGDAAIALAKKWIADPNSVPVSLWTTVLSTAVEVAPDDMIPALMKRVAGEKESRIARPIYQALARAPDAKSYDAVLATLLGGTAITADMLSVLRRPWRVELQGRAFDFLRDHWDDLVARTPEDFRGSLSPYVCDAKRRDELVAFLKAKVQPLPDIGELRTKQQIEAIDRCIAENGALAPAVTTWLHH